MKVYAVVNTKPGSSPAMNKVFAQYNDALAFAEELNRVISNANKEGTFHILVYELITS